jgi:hypothetical protein
MAAFALMKKLSLLKELFSKCLTFIQSGCEFSWREGQAPETATPAATKVYVAAGIRTKLLFVDLHSRHLLTDLTRFIQCKSLFAPI